MKRLIFIAIIILSAGVLRSQSVTISGKVIDKVTRSGLESASVSIPALRLRSGTDVNGKYQLKGAPLGNFEIVFSYVGYKTVVKTINLSERKIYELNAEMSVSPIELGEALVTSSRTVHIERELPLPLELVTEEEIIRSVNSNLPGIAASNPGIDAVRDGAWGAGINIRGLSKQNVVYMIDGNRIETATNIAGGLSLIDLDDINSVEIVKGGLSSLYGTGATGGVVNIETKKGMFNESNYFSGSVRGSYSSVNKGSTGGVLLRSGGKNWFLKLNGSVRNAGNINTPIGIMPNSNFRDRGVSVSAGYKPTEKLELQLDYQNYKADDAGIPGGEPFPQNATAKYSDISREMFSGKVTFNGVFAESGKMSLKFYRQLIKRAVELVPNTNAVIRPSADHTTDGIIFQSDFVLGRTHYLIAGLDLWQRHMVSRRTKTNIPDKIIVGDIPVPDSKFRSAGLFVQDEMQLFKNRLKLTVGGRFDFINVSNKKADNPDYIINNNIINESPPVNPLASYDPGEVDNRSWSGNIGLLYSASKSLDVSFNAAKTFRSPSLEERFEFIDLGSLIYLGNSELQPEKGLSLDLGFRIWMDCLSIKTDAFINLFSDLVIDQVEIPDSIYKKQNVGRARLYGFDLSAEYNYYKNFSVLLSAAYVRGEDTERRADLPQIPPLNGRVTMKFPVYKFFNLDISAVFYADQNFTAEGENRTPGYSVYNISYYSNQLKLSNLYFQLFAGIENIFRRSYKNHLSTYRGMVHQEPGQNVYFKISLNW